MYTIIVPDAKKWPMLKNFTTLLQFPPPPPPRCGRCIFTTTAISYWRIISFKHHKFKSGIATNAHLKFGQFRWKRRMIRRLMEVYEPADLSFLRMMSPVHTKHNNANLNNIFRRARIIILIRRMRHDRIHYLNLESVFRLAGN